MGCEAFCVDCHTGEGTTATFILDHLVQYPPSSCSKLETVMASLGGVLGTSGIDIPEASWRYTSLSAKSWDFRRGRGS